MCFLGSGTIHHQAAQQRLPADLMSGSSLFPFRIQLSEQIADDLSLRHIQMHLIEIIAALSEKMGHSGELRQSPHHGFLYRRGQKQAVVNLTLSVSGVLMSDSRFDQEQITLHRQ
jgi:hypothetical protein